MTKETYFLKSVNNEIKSVHIVSRPYPFTEKDAYRQSLSYDSFKNNEAKRLIKNQEKEDESYYFDYSQKQFEKEKPFLNDVPIYKHNSIWDFYQEIGYDYKSKKYI
jgi:hypothetical protein